MPFLNSQLSATGDLRTFYIALGTSTQCMGFGTHTLDFVTTNHGKRLVSLHNHEKTVAQQQSSPIKADN